MTLLPSYSGTCGRDLSATLLQDWVAVDLPRKGWGDVVKSEDARSEEKWLGELAICFEGFGGVDMGGDMFLLVREQCWSSNNTGR